MNKKIKIDQNHNDNLRLDTFLSKQFPDYSRNYFSNLIKAGQVMINGKAQKSHYLVRPKDVIELTLSEQINNNIQPTGEDIPLNIIFESDDVIVINKQPGLVVHPAAGHKEGTLVNAVINHYPEIKKVIHNKTNPVSITRPGLVHRLDKDTSGIIILAKNARAMHSLSKQYQNRTIKKHYLGLCCGWPKQGTGKLKNYLGRHPKNRKVYTEVGEKKGKEALLQYNVVRYFTDENKNKFTLIDFNLLTGRTHQIRVQSHILGCPIMGDKIYGNKQSMILSSKHNINRQLLHAAKLIITLPGDNSETEFIAETPDDFYSFIENLTEISS